MNRFDCPICGNELRLPHHRFGTKFTPAEIYWANKLRKAGLPRKAVARYFNVSVPHLADVLRCERMAERAARVMR